MREALLEAERAASDGEVPVGAILVHEHTIIALSLIHISEPTRPY